MKIVYLSVCLFFLSCDNRTSEQKVNDSLNDRYEKEMKTEAYVDSLVRVAYGDGDNKYLTKNRINAIEKLKVEFSGNDSIQTKLESLKLEIINGDY